jgi:hypothetical protein
MHEKSSKITPTPGLRAINPKHTALTIASDRSRKAPEAAKDPTSAGVVVADIEGNEL